MILLLFEYCCLEKLPVQEDAYPETAMKSFYYI
jgi:hypothetical protein